MIVCLAWLHTTMTSISCDAPSILAGHVIAVCCADIQSLHSCIYQP